ncbi:hypothetical protein B566_EDAN015176 [Ephemera danica]|nr:hypothetical protein B566_EDAN015176 [Ephemera danica]
MDEGMSYYLAVNLIICTCALYWYKYERKKRLKPKARRFAVRPLFQSRKTQGEFVTLFQEIKDDDPELFFKYTRMSRSTYDRLLEIVGPKLDKKCRTNRKISAEQRLAFTLKYIFIHRKLTSVTELGISFRQIHSLQHRKRNMAELHPLVLQPPTRSEWKQIADEYLSMWNLPNCCGSIDGKYIFMQAPKNTGSTFYCHKHFFAIVLMALCDAKYRFRWVDIGAPGSESDGGVLQRSDLGLALHNRIMNFPDPQQLPNSNQVFPYYFVGDEAFALSSNLLRPYPGTFLALPKKIFNYRLSRARRTIENTFGILVARWQIFRKPINASKDTVKSITKACICLHNFLMLSPDSKMYCPDTLVNMTNSKEWRREMQNSALAGLEPCEHVNSSFLRDSLANYLMTEGAVTWQWRHVRKGSTPNYTG